MAFEAFKLKAIWIDEENLYISNYFKEIVVPFNQITSIQETNFGNRKAIRINFRSKSEFSDKVKFLPKFHLAFFKTHPIIDELNKIIRNNRSK